MPVLLRIAASRRDELVKCVCLLERKGLDELTNLLFMMGGDSALSRTLDSLPKKGQPFLYL